MVALFHSFHFLPIDGLRIYSLTLANSLNFSTDAFLMRLVLVPLNGAAAVSLFFVLSGFVLALSLRRSSKAGVGKAFDFAMRRFLRIYPTLAINVLILAAAIASLSTFVPSLGTAAFSSVQITKNLLLQDFDVNGATWSLMVELAAIPFLLAGDLIIRLYGISGIVFLTLLGIVVLFSPNLVAHALIGDFVFMFFAGMLVAEFLSRRSMALTRRTAITTAITAVALMLCARYVLGYGSKWSILLEGLSSAALISALLFGPRFWLHDVLSGRLLRFLGRISYSFYLYHPLALAVLVPLMTVLVGAVWTLDHPFLFSAAIAISTLALSIPLGYASYKWIERSMIRPQ